MNIQQSVMKNSRANDFLNKTGNTNQKSMFGASKKTTGKNNINESNNRYIRKVQRDKEAKDMMSMYDPAINSWREHPTSQNTVEKQMNKQSSDTDLNKLNKKKVPNFND